ncbi:MAG: metal-sensing transcriptional repressor [Lachnospiraceae bacterium]|nr:metal-sensing transcriptional repressor [Lachnospiraceae bacterium]MCH4070898.1 metal-sensing transcriptional repressor [Lachnospiraceae bacterium]MCH4107887.1 metal-sensing transcriptional repressor [Lachnospiraceae bacterium]MCI1332289.1 metal-sensing transcriptional repressor [Lachnospiraceae bacterium]MCI1361593.1 metal-sensing transcriptional repressor [Lachnospiraceae bacterium]
MAKEGQEGTRINTNAEHVHEGHEHGHAEHMHEGHEHEHEHTHTHDPEVIRKISLRLAKAEGHLHSVRGMLDSGRDCSEVLLQLAAVRAAIDNAGKELLKEHISHCIVDAIRENDRHELDELNKAIDQFMK